MTAGSILLQMLLFVLGLAALYLGAEGLVRGASNLARSLHIRPIIIGLTVVAFGTSAPELIVSLLAVVQKSEEIAIGNILGSNIANIGLVLGVAALLRPLRVETKLIQREVPIMIGASLLLYGLAAWGKQIGRFDGAILFVGILIFLLYSYAGKRKHPVELEGAVFSEAKFTIRDLLFLLAGLGALLAGAQLLIRSAVFLAQALGVSEGAIGLSLVAFGTSLPELATSAVAAVRQEMDISIGNVVGSNIFNILAVIGPVSLVQPLGVGVGWLWFQFPVTLIFALALFPIMKTGAVINRWEGGLLLAGYGVFLAWLFRT